MARPTRCWRQGRCPWMSTPCQGWWRMCLMSRNWRRKAEWMLYRMEMRVISARKRVTRRGNAGSLMNGIGKTRIRNLGETLETPVVTPPAPQFCVIIAGRRVIYPGNVGENGGNRGGEETAVRAADRWRIWLDPWRRCKKFWRNWFQRRFFPRE